MVSKLSSRTKSRRREAVPNSVHSAHMTCKLLEPFYRNPLALVLPSFPASSSVFF